MTEHGKVLAAYLDYMTKVRIARTYSAREFSRAFSRVTRRSRHGFQIGVLLGGEENSTRRQMQDVIDFETKLAEITTPPDERRDEEKLYNLMPLSELQRKAAFVRFRSFAPRNQALSG